MIGGFFPPCWRFIDVVLRSPVQVRSWSSGERKTSIYPSIGQQERLDTAYSLSPPPSSPLFLARLFPLLLLLLLRCCSSIIPVPPGCFREESTPPSTATPSRHDGPQAIFCVDVSILRYSSDQIWIMHLIFLATLLVSTLSPWLHPLLASSGTYAALVCRFLNHFHVLKWTFYLMLVRNIILNEPCNLLTDCLLLDSLADRNDGAQGRLQHLSLFCSYKNSALYYVWLPHLNIKSKLY